MASIETTLSERGSRYGIFAVHAEHTQAIKKLLIDLMGEMKWACLHADQKEALEMIAHKLGRITNGDPNYDDSWRDIAGYAQLVANRLASQVEVAAEPALKDVGCASEQVKQPAFEVGDRVKITDDPMKAKAACEKSAAGWMPRMLDQCGMLGTIAETSEHSTFRVSTLAGHSFWWAGECLTPAPTENEVKIDTATPGADTSVHMVILDGSDPDVEAIQRMLEGFLRGCSK